MPHTAEPGTAAAVERRPVSQAGAAVGRRALKQLGDNPLLAVFGTALVAILIFNLTITHERINRLEDSMDTRFARLEDRMDARFNRLEEDFAALKESVAETNVALTAMMSELDRKLTALIATPNMADRVSAAIEGRLIDGTPAPDPGATDAASGTASANDPPK